MKPSIFLNDMLTKGAILGGVMAASAIVEMMMLYYGGNTAWLTAMTVEVLVVVALYIWLTLRFTKGYAKLVLAEREKMPYFSYGSGLSYVISISMLAGVIAALGSYMFRHYIIGFENYMTANVKLIQDVLSQTEVPASMVGTYEQLFKAMQSQDEPSLISTLFSSVTNYLLAGTFVGLIVAAITKREPKIFDNQNEQ